MDVTRGFLSISFESEIARDKILNDTGYRHNLCYREIPGEVHKRL